MSVFREVKMTYDGEEYWLTPSNRLLRRIEAEMAPSSLTDMIARIGHGKPPVSEVALVVTEFLKAAGAQKVDEDQMYSDLMGDLMDGGQVFSSMCEAIVTAISRRMMGEKSPRPAPKARRPRGSAQNKLDPDVSTGCWPVRGSAKRVLEHDHSRVVCALGGSPPE